ncbi:MAG TPA: hypothetical protein VGA61_04075 [Anaerolineae bacterium]
MIRTLVFRWLSLILVLLFALAAAGPSPFAAPPAQAAYGSHALCDQNSTLCTEVFDSLNYKGVYTGHDEPSLLFYSNTAGSGNSNLYTLTLPADPPTLPTQDGKGGTFNFQLHPAFWFGMAMCDTESAPEFTKNCVADSDGNIFNSPDPTSPKYIGRHPGAAFMEMQFYPPGWAPWPAGVSCDATHWCAALNIDSLSQDQNTGVVNNTACLSTVGIEPVNFAFITRSGVADSPGDPQHFEHFVPNLSTDLLMNPGDRLTVALNDTADGFAVVIHDLTTGASGSMTASVANGFAQIVFAPTAATCTSRPYAFHPMYSTSSEDTRLPWTAHSYNVAFSDEIGHFEYCATVDAAGNCTQPGANDPAGVDSDDNGCFDAGDSTRVAIGGCLGTDVDFDGVPYQHTWPGSLSNPGADSRLNPRPVRFSSPLFRTTAAGALTNYSRVAFEADLPRIEIPSLSPNNHCNRTTGAGCVNPPAGANFYPIYTTAQEAAACKWQLGGASIPGTQNTFGGNSTAEYGPLLLLAYPVAGFHPSFRYNNFRQVLADNPCPTGPAGP